MEGGTHMPNEARKSPIKFIVATVIILGTNPSFDRPEPGPKLPVVYQGSEPPPDTFKDDAQALAVGTYGHDGVFHATEVQAKCASKYAPPPPTPTPGAP